MTRHIALVLAAPFPSSQGSQVYVRGMARALLRRGHQVSLVAYGYGTGEEESGVERVRVPVPPGYRRLRAGPDLVKPAIDLALAYALARHAADVWHVHNYEALAAALFARVLRAASLALGGGAERPIPIVYNNHNLLELELPTYFQHFLPVWSALGRAVDGVLPRRADAAIAITAGAATALRAHGCRRVWFVPPGVHRDDFEGVTLRRAGEGRWVVYAGNPDAYQSIDTLLAAMKLLPGWKLLVVTASDWNPAGATVVRSGSWSETRDWIAGADVAAVPRQLGGGFPLKLLNALALGVPVVTTEGAAQGLAGEVVVGNGDAAAFARGVEEAGGWTTEAREQLRLTTLARCAWDARAAELDGVYDLVTSTLMRT